MVNKGKEGKLRKTWIVNISIKKQTNEFLLSDYIIVETKKTKHRDL